MGCVFLQENTIAGAQQQPPSEAETVQEAAESHAQHADEDKDEKLAQQVGEDPSALPVEHSTRDEQPAAMGKEDGDAVLVNDPPVLGTQAERSTENGSAVFAYAPIEDAAQNNADRYHPLPNPATSFLLAFQFTARSPVKIVCHQPNLCNASLQSMLFSLLL